MVSAWLEGVANGRARASSKLSLADETCRDARFLLASFVILSAKQTRVEAAAKRVVLSGFPSLNSKLEGRAKARFFSSCKDVRFQVTL